MYLEGQTYEEIMRRSRHSAFSIKRYVLGFGRLLLLMSGGIEDVKSLSRLLNQSERLTLEYLDIYARHKAGERWPSVYMELLEQLKAMYPSKKKSSKGVRHES